MRLTWKIALLVVLASLATLAGSTVIRLRREAALFDSDMRVDAIAMGRLLARSVEAVWDADGEDAARELIERTNSGLPQNEVSLVWLDGGPGPAPAVGVSRLEGVRQGHLASVTIENASDGSGDLYTYVPVALPLARVAAIEVRESLDRVQQYLDGTVRNTLIAALLMVVVGAGGAQLLGFVTIGRTTRRLVLRLRRAAEGELEETLDITQRDELGELARELDRTTARLLEAQTRLRAETSERLRTEEQLRHVDRLTTIGQLASGIAHELGTPLNVASMRAQLIAGGEVTAGEARDNARIIAEQVDRISSLVRQLLDFARRRPTDMREISLRALAARCIEMVAPLARRGGVVLRLQEGQDQLQANVDPTQMEQVLMNLLMNALHATASGGEVWVRGGRAETDAGAGAFRRYVTISVADNGAGMNEETRTRVFEPFFTTKGSGEGTGLGLSLARRIVEEHDGFITVDSEVGRGTTFNVHLPEATT